MKSLNLTKFSNFYLLFCPLFILLFIFHPVHVLHHWRSIHALYQPKREHVHFSRRWKQWHNKNKHRIRCKLGQCNKKKIYSFICYHIESCLKKLSGSTFLWLVRENLKLHELYKVHFVTTQKWKCCWIRELILTMQALVSLFSLSFLTMVNANWMFASM